MRYLLFVLVLACTEPAATVRPSVQDSLISVSIDQLTLAQKAVDSIYLNGKLFVDASNKSALVDIDRLSAYVDSIENLLMPYDSLLLSKYKKKQKDLFARSIAP